MEPDEQDPKPSPEPLRLVDGPDEIEVSTIEVEAIRSAEANAAQARMNVVRLFAAVLMRGGAKGSDPKTWELVMPKNDGEPFKIVRKA